MGRNRSGQLARIAPRAGRRLRDAARLAAFAVPLGPELVPPVLLHPSVIKRFAISAPGLPPVARRSARTNLRFLARCVVPALVPADAPLPRERAKARYSLAEIDGYLHRCRDAGRWRWCSSSSRRPANAGARHRPHLAALIRRQAPGPRRGARSEKRRQVRERGALIGPDQTETKVTA